MEKKSECKILSLHILSWGRKCCLCQISFYCFFLHVQQVEFCFFFEVFNHLLLNGFPNPFLVVFRYDFFNQWKFVESYFRIFPVFRLPFFFIATFWSRAKKSRRDFIACFTLCSWIRLHELIPLLVLWVFLLNSVISLIFYLTKENKLYTRLNINLECKLQLKPINSQSN